MSHHRGTTESKRRTFCGRGSRHGISASAGVTLVEMLIVLALMAVVGGLAWPVMAKSFAGYRLRAAADSVRAQWCLARVEAMRSGQTYTFRYAADGVRYRREQQNDMSGAPAAEMTPPPAAVGDALSAATAEEVLPLCDEQQLPEGIMFLTPETMGLPVDMLDGDMPSMEEDIWSDPILFHPDGTTSDARLALKNNRGSMMELNLRGLTGTVTLSEVLDELP